MDVAVAPAFADVIEHGVVDERGHAVRDRIADEGKTITVRATSTVDTAKSGTATLKVKDWTAVETSSFGTTAINGIAYGSSKYVAVGASGKIAHSDDGTNWTAIVPTTTATSTPTGFTANANGNINGVIYAGNQFIAYGNKGGMAYSTNGTDWTAIAVGATTTGFTASQAINGIAYNGSNKYVAVGAAGVISTSGDGHTWTTLTPAPFGTDANCIRSSRTL
jgi:photosystem II stability/assembly factor-like uncharacterized protein